MTTCHIKSITNLVIVYDQNINKKSNNAKNEEQKLLIIHSRNCAMFR